ncbi:hypothetical protein BBJ28_00009931 [Nothophytophthora sp. Chile5]|nr:hypothetical protein BBJ28_00009931 [Nothophytophthora sp. Chile5]
MEPSDPSCSPRSSRQQQRHSAGTPSASRAGRKLRSLIVGVVAAAVALSFIFYAIHIDRAFYSAYLLQACLAVGSLQKSWWHYRIRQRFLAPLDAEVAALFAAGDQEAPRLGADEYERMLREKMEPKTFAMTRVANKWMKEVRGATGFMTLSVALAVSAVTTTIAVFCERTVVMCAIVGPFFGVVCACLSPTPSDGVAILINETAFTVSTMNTMVAHYASSEASPEILDYLFVALAGWVLIVITRFVACKKILNCALMVTFDAVALLHLTLTMMEFVDFVSHPNANKLSDELAAFFITVASAELGHFVFDMVTTECAARCCWRWGGCTSSRMAKAGDFVVSVLFGVAGTLGWMLFVRSHTMGVWHFITLLGTAALSQAGRSILVLIHETAMVHPWGSTTFSVWNNGVMELINPFLIGWIVFHPYAKYLLEAAGSY